MGKNFLRKKEISQKFFSALRAIEESHYFRGWGSLEVLESHYFRPDNLCLAANLEPARANLGQLGGNLNPFRANNECLSTFFNFSPCRDTSWGPLGANLAANLGQLGASSGQLGADLKPTFLFVFSRCASNMRFTLQLGRRGRRRGGDGERSRA